MNFLQSCDPVEIATKHEAIVDALDRGQGSSAARLLSSHALGLVQFLEEEAAKKRGEVATPA